MGVEHESNEKGSAMTKQEECLAQEREEIATRIAKFKATQQKFEREREEYFLTTMQNARKTERPSFWS
jgi:chorismate mutase